MGRKIICRTERIIRLNIKVDKIIKVVLKNTKVGIKEMKCGGSY